MSSAGYVSGPTRPLGLFLLASLATSQGVRVNGPLAHGSGFDAEDVLGFRISPDGCWAVFFADTELGENRFELFSAPIDGSAAARRLSGPLVAGGNLAVVYEDPYFGDFVEPPHLEISSGNRVVYRGDQDTDEVQELFSAPIDGSAPPVKLSGTMVSGGDVQTPFLVSPDGSRVLFLADRETNGVIELFSVPIDGGAAPVRLNATPLPSSGFEPSGQLPAAVAPDGITVVYRLDQATSNVDELWAVPIDGSAAPVRLNAPLVAGGDVFHFEISPDGTQVLYRADQATDGRIELWRVPLDGSAFSVRVNGTLATGNGVATSFSISPDGQRAVYHAIQVGDGLARHYSATLVGAPQVVALYEPASSALGIFEAIISPDGARVVLWGDLLENEVYEVFSVPIDGSAPPLRLNASLVAGGDVGDQGIGNSFRVTPDGSRVVYWADQASVNVMELWSVPIDRSTEPVRVNGALVAGGGVQFPFRFAGDGSRLLYLADQRVDGRFELWSAPSDGGAAPLRISGQLVPAGDVQAEGRTVLHTGFDATPDGTRVVYRADQSSNEDFALWSVPSDRSEPPRELNGALDPGPVTGDVTSFAWAPDGTRVLYCADQDQDEAFQVHAAALARRTLLEPIPSHALGAGSVFQVSPDGGWAAFRQAPSCEMPPYCTPSAGLYGAPVDGSEVPVRWNPTLSGYASPFVFDPSGQRVVFRQIASGYRYSYSGLYSFAVHAGSEPISLTEPPGMLPDFAQLWRFAVSPDGARVVYHLTHWSENALWSVPIDRGLAPVALTDTFLTPTEIHDTFQVTPDGQGVVFVADLLTSGVFELFRAQLDGTGRPVRLGAPLPAFADVDPAFVLHGTEVLFVADLLQDEVWTLWSAPLDPARGRGPVQLSGKPLPGGAVARGVSRTTGGLEFDVEQARFAVSAAAGRVVFVSDELVPGRLELLSAPLDGSAGPVRLNAPLGPGQNVALFGFRLDPLGKRVVFAAPDKSGLLRLHAAPLDGRAPPVALGGPFVPGGGLWTHPHDGAALSFELTPDGATAVYLADQLEDEVIELFAVATDGSTPARRLNRRLVAGGDVRLPGALVRQAPFALSPDGRLVVYGADQETDEVFELFASALDTDRVRPSGAPSFLPSPLGSGWAPASGTGLLIH